MGYQQKKWNENYMGDPGKRNANKGTKKNPVEGGKKFKEGAILKGLPGQESDFPKAGRGPDWKMARHSKPSKGSI